MEETVMEFLKRLKFGVFISVLTILTASLLYAQTPIGGPYQPDSSTVLLLHFDGNLNNASQFSADGVGHGKLYYVPNTPLGLGQCLRINNDSQSDSSYVTVADTAALDLSGDWTIEGWINIFTFGETSGDWRWVPRLVMKPGSDTFWLPNYFVEMWGDGRRFECGYNVQGQYLWPKVVSPNNLLVPGQWLHLTFIRDTSRHLLILLIHNAERKLVVFNVSSYDPVVDNPPTITTSPVNIGYGGGGDDSWLDGFVDEVRISNVVRQFAVPPIITNVTQLNNQTADVASYEINAKIYTLFSTTVQSAVIYYNTGSGWQEAAMTSGADSTYTGVIPQQPVGSVISYYVKATDDSGMVFTQPAYAETDSSYYTFGIYKPKSETLDLSFEAGTGTPTDGSIFGNKVTMAGNPTYSTDAAVGNYSIFLEGDSSYLEVDSPFLSSPEFTVDFWFNADSIHNYCRIINRPIAPDNWYQNAYQVRFNPGSRLYAGSWNEAEGYLSVALEDSIELGKWYHVIYEVAAAPEGDTAKFYGILQLRDANDIFLSQGYFAFNDTVVQAMAPLRIGYAAGRPHFAGKLDDIKVYNYAEAGLTPTSVETRNGSEVPMRFGLSQNYPNPFNPTTAINYSVAKYQNVSIVVYDLMGREVKTLLNKKAVPGKYTIRWDGTNELGRKVASGLYFYKMKSGKMVNVKKMLLMR